MKIEKRAALQNLSLLALILIYPLDMISYAFVGEGLSMGMCGILIALIVSPFIFSEKASVWLLVGFIVIFILLFFSIYSYISTGNYGEIYFWIRSVSFFCLGYFLVSKDGVVLGKKIFYLMLLVYFLDFFLVIAYYEQKGNYLRVADAIAVFGLLLIANSKKMRWVLTGMTLVLLYYVGSRSALVLMFLGVAFALVRVYKKKGITVLLGGGCASYAYLSWMYEKVENIHNFRFLRLVFEREVDTSLAGRSAFLSDAIKEFLSNPILGNYAYYRRQGIEGGYAHNFVSYVSELGLAGGIFLMIFFVVVFFAITKILKADFEKISEEKKVIYFFVLALSMISLVGLLLAKSYHWGLIYLSLGLSVGLMSSSKNISFGK